MPLAISSWTRPLHLLRVSTPRASNPAPLFVWPWTRPGFLALSSTWSPTGRNSLCELASVLVGCRPPVHHHPHSCAMLRCIFQCGAVRLACNTPNFFPNPPMVLPSFFFLFVCIGGSDGGNSKAPPLFLHKSKNPLTLCGSSGTSRAKPLLAPPSHPFSTHFNVHVFMDMHAFLFRIPEHAHSNNSAVGRGLRE